MILLTRTLKITALLVVFALGYAHAEERQLSEANVQKIIPVLRAEAASLAAAQTMVETENATRTGFSGDPLEFFRGRAKIDLPEGARYMAPCSQAASTAGPVAIFTFGRTIDCYQRALRDWARTAKRGQDEKLPELPIPQSCYTEKSQTEKFLDGVREGLEKRGFKVVNWYESGGDFDWADEMLNLELRSSNIYDRANRPDDHPLFLTIESEPAREKALAACSTMSSGPILIIRPGGRFFAGESGGGREAALKKAGLSEQEYEALKEALFMARMDVEQGMLQAAEAAAGSDPEAQKDLAIRRANANLYRKLASQLHPLLNALVPQP